MSLKEFSSQSVETVSLCVCVGVCVCICLCVCLALVAYYSETIEPILMRFLLLNLVLGPIDCVKM